MNARRLWIIGGVIVAVAVVALGWFVAISPLLQQARQADDQAAASQQQLDQAQLQLGALQKEYKDIDRLQAQLDQLSQSVPSTGEVSEFVRQLSSAAQAAGVTISSINPGSPAAYSPPPSPPPAVTPAPSAAATDAATPAPTGTGTPAPSTTPTAQAPSDAAITSKNFFQLPVSLTAAGPRAKLLDFVHALQSGDQRLFTISSASVQAGSDGTDTTGGATATLTGDVYVLLPVK